MSANDWKRPNSQQSYYTPKFRRASSNIDNQDCKRGANVWVRIACSSLSSINRTQGHSIHSAAPQSPQGRSETSNLFGAPRLTKAIHNYRRVYTSGTYNSRSDSGRWQNLPAYCPVAPFWDSIFSDVSSHAMYVNLLQWTASRFFSVVA